MGKTQDILSLLEKGFVPYPCAVPAIFYKRRRCLKPEKAEWFILPCLKNHSRMRGICLGCQRRCAAVNPKNWPPLVEERPRARAGIVAFAALDMLSVDELLRIKRVLRVEEAAWALNVSRQVVYKFVDEGMLEPVPGSPMRVTCSSVRRILSPSPAGA